MGEKGTDIRRKTSAARLREIRKQSKNTQESFSELLNISTSAYKKLESGENQISVRCLERLYRKLDVSADFILFGKEVQLEEKTKMLLSEFSYTEIQKACETIKQIAFFMKDSKK